MMTESAVKTRRRIRKAPTAFHHGDLRAAAIHVAGQAIEELGHDALTLDRVASRLGVTRPALYRHFADRDALLEAVAADGFERFNAAFHAGLVSSTDAGQCLLAGCHAYVRFAAENRGWFRLQFSRAPGGSGGSHVATPRPYVEVMRGHLAALVGDDAEEVSVAFRLLWATAHGLAHLVVEGAFQRVKTDAARMAVAHQTLALQVELLVARRALPAR